MELSQRAIALLSQVENSLRQLMAEGLESQSYSAVAQIAGVAEGVATLKNGLVSLPNTLLVRSPNTLVLRSPNTLTDSASAGWNGLEQDADEPGSLATSDSKLHASNASVARRQSYPRFQKDGDKLVKIGWSDRDQRAYEHRAPWEVVLSVCEALNKRSVRGRRFKMEEVLPELNELKEPVPSYQGYLTLAWLRSEGVIERDGKEGYRVKGGSLSAERIEKLWASLSERLSR